MNTSLRVSTEGDEFLSSDSEGSDSPGQLNSTGDPSHISLEPDISNILKNQKQNQKLQKRLDREKGARNDLQNKNYSLSEDVKHLKEKLNVLTKEKMDLEKSKIEMDAQIKKLSINLKDETEKRQNFESLLAITKKELTQLSESFKSHNILNSSIEDSQVLSNIESNRLLKDVKESIDYFETLGREPPAPNLERRRSSVSNLQIEKQLFSVKAEFEEEKFAYEKQINKLSFDNNILKDQIEKLNNDLKLDDSMMEDKFSQYIVELEQLKLENKKLLQNNKDLKSELEVKDSERASIESEFNNTSIIMQSNIDLLKQDIERLTAELVTKDSKYQIEIDSLRKSLNEKDDLITILKKELAERDEQIKNLLTELGTRDDSFRINQMSADRIRDENVALKKEFEELMSKFQLSETKASDLKKRLDGEEGQVVKLQQLNERIKDDLTKSAEELTRLIADKSEFQTKYSDSERNISNLRFENEQMLRDLKNLANELSEKEQQLNGMQEASINYKKMLADSEKETSSAQMKLALEEEKFERYKLEQELSNQQLNDKIKKLENANMHFETLLDDKDTHYSDALLKIKENNDKLQNVIIENQINNNKSTKKYSSAEEISEKYNNKNKRKTKHIEIKYPQKTFNYESELARLKLEMESRVQMQLNEKLNLINQYLTEHSSTSDEILRMRENNENALRRQLALAQMNVKDDLMKFNNKSEFKIDLLNVKNNEYSNRSEIKKMQEANESMKMLLNKMNTSTMTPLILNNHRNVDFDLNEELNRSIAKHLEKEPRTNLTPIILTDPDLLEGKSKLIYNLM